MKVALISTYLEQGGAAIACYRLFQALKNNNVDAKLVVARANNSFQNKNIKVVLNSKLKLSFNTTKFAFEKLSIKWTVSERENLFRFSTMQYGCSISNLPEILDADIIHLHWINNGFISMNELEKLVLLNKPIVWTMHDMFPFTGGCHHSRHCENFQTSCHECFYLKPNKNNASKILDRKRKIYRNIHAVACSKWLKKRAEKSRGLFDSIQDIPNSLNPLIFKENNRQTIRENLSFNNDSKVILFVAAHITDKRKGIGLLIDALKILKDNTDYKNLCLLIVGEVRDDKIFEVLDMPILRAGYVTLESEMIKFYTAADVFVTPSLEENLPNTIMESMACSTPCVGFKVGGIPEMIDHKVNGFVANADNSKSLADGLDWVLNRDLRALARAKVELKYEEKHVVNQYRTLYQKLLKQN